MRTRAAGSLGLASHIAPSEATAFALTMRPGTLDPIDQLLLAADG